MEATALRKLDAVAENRRGVRLKSGTDRHGVEQNYEPGGE